MPKSRLPLLWGRSMDAASAMTKTIGDHNTERLGGHCNGSVSFEGHGAGALIARGIRLNLFD